MPREVAKMGRLFMLWQAILIFDPSMVGVAAVSLSLDRTFLSHNAAQFVAGKAAKRGNLGHMPLNQAQYGRNHHHQSGWSKHMGQSHGC